MNLNRKFREIPLWLAFLPILILVIFLSVNVFVFPDALGGPNQIALLLSAGVAGLIAWSLGFSWHKLQEGILQSIHSSMSAILILLIIGALAGTWMVSGIVPTMIYYGLKILHPSYFLVASCVICSLISLATGSSWSTVATVGVALLGVGNALGINEGITAGAIISGAYFGDKISPLSDTTNLAPAMAGTDLFTHIRYMTLTTIPTLAITLIIFTVIGLSTNFHVSKSGVDNLLHAIENKFFISPILFLVPIVVIVLIVKKVDALPALLIGSLLGALFAIIFQAPIIKEISGISNNYFKASYSTFFQSMSFKTSIDTGNATINDLLTTKGMHGMLNTIWLIVCAMTFGGIMEASGMLQKITDTIVKKAKSTGSLISSTALTCIFFNATASDQYLAIVVPGKMFAKTFNKRGLAPENLSRTLEDSGTVTSVLFPWNTCGATQASVLGVATGSYWMYCFFNLISPIMTIIFGIFQIKIKKLKIDEQIKSSSD
ncbi:MAG: Na+/H+ antiporter NhaC [Flavobacteriia bacterium]|nr:Na+/H+ antiporter NhaC [Flavobacteriia bacterium]